MTEGQKTKGEVCLLFFKVVSQGLQVDLTTEMLKEIRIWKDEKHACLKYGYFPFEVFLFGILPLN